MSRRSGSGADGAPNYYRARVARIVTLTPGMVRITLTDPLLADYPSTGVGDEYLRLHFPLPSGELPTPELDDEGNWSYEGEQPAVVVYTIRAFRPEACEIDIDFVIHGHGAATEWARRATVGDELAFGRSRGLFSPPADATTMVFVTDATGIPALGRLLSELAPTVQAICVVEVAEASHEQVLPSPARTQLRWLPGRGNGVGPSAMTEALRAIEIPDDAYVWVAGESRELRAARKHLRHERGLTADRYTVIGYWTDQQEAWLEQYRALDDDTLASLESIWRDDDADEEARRDRYEAELTSLGL